MKTFIKIIISSIIAVYCSCAASPPEEELVNEKASLPASFQFDKLGLKVIATFIDKNERTMSTLYGNSLACQAAKAGEHKIVNGEVFALITWKQQADKNWYGANIQEGFKLLRCSVYQLIQGIAPSIINVTKAKLLN